MLNLQQNINSYSYILYNILTLFLLYFIFKFNYFNNQNNTLEKIIYIKSYYINELKKISICCLV